MERLVVFLGLLAGCGAGAVQTAANAPDAACQADTAESSDAQADRLGARIGLWDESGPFADHAKLSGRVRIVDGAGVADHATEAALTVLGLEGPGPGAGQDSQIWAHDWLFDLAELRAAGPHLDVSVHPYAPAGGWQTYAGCRRPPTLPTLPTWHGEAGAWEDAAFGKYGRAASELDRILHRLDLPSVWTAGNQRLDVGAMPGREHHHFPSCQDVFTDRHGWEVTLQYDTIGGEAAAKNAITVGAVGRGDAGLPGRWVALSASGFGPMDDGRIKPDLAAEVDGGSRGGTSAASALVAGLVATLAARHRELHGGRDARAAELKALLVHTAREAGTSRGPDYRMGHGVVDPDGAMRLLERSAQHFRAGVSDATPQTVTTLELAAGTPLRVTLAWLDPAAAPNLAGTDDPTPALVNDLDLTLVAPDGQTRFHPWRLDPAAPAAAAVRAGANRVDPVEVVDVDGPDNVWTGAWTLRVTTRGGLARDVQAFALVSSVALSRFDRPILSASGRIEISVRPGAAPDAVSLPIENLGAGVLDWRVSTDTEWLGVSPRSGRLPELPSLRVDASAIATARGSGPLRGRLRLESDADPTAALIVGVLLQVACAPDCDAIECGADPVCGASCGSCGSGQACDASGRCSPWAGSCPHAELGSALGQQLVHGSYDRLGRTAGSCGGAGSWDVAFGWSAPEQGFYRFSTEGSEVDTVLYLRDGCDGSELACNDDLAGRPGSAVAAQLDVGQRIVAVVDGFDATSTAAFALHIARAACPDADLASGLGHALVRASTAGSVDRLSGSCGGDGPEAAFGFTAPADGDYSFVASTAFDSVLYVLRDSCIGAQLDCSGDAVAGRHEITLGLAAGERVVVVIDGQDGARGDFQLDVLSAAIGCDDGCVIDCQPGCAGRPCGGDGCGGSCGRCASGDRCDGGTCVSDPCAGVSCDACDACEGGICRPLSDGAACEDAELCTWFDSCAGGVCAGVEASCDDGDDCTSDRCDPATGGCVHDPVEGCEQTVVESSTPMAPVAPVPWCAARP